MDRIQLFWGVNSNVGEEERREDILGEENTRSKARFEWDSVTIRFHSSGKDVEDLRVILSATRFESSSGRANSCSKYWPNLILDIQ